MWGDDGSLPDQTADSEGDVFTCALLPLLEGKPVIHSAGLATTCKIFRSFLAHLDLRLDLLHTPKFPTVLLSSDS